LKVIAHFINEGVSAGFPSAADFMEMSIDLNKQLSETRWLLYIKVKGNSMIDAVLMTRMCLLLTEV
jgi:SOS-response transcriptional repressor LexA